MIKLDLFAALYIITVYILSQIRSLLMYLIIYIDVYAYICIFIDPAELEEIGAVLKIRCNWSDLLVGLRFLIAAA